MTLELKIMTTGQRIFVSIATLIMERMHHLKEHFATNILKLFRFCFFFKEIYIEASCTNFVFDVTWRMFSLF